MGTLTADIPRLDTHCDHKLPTSCRLTSTPLCCACADNRPHSSTYRVYIDGVGFVQRGTRWQSYCWFCKVFWNARVAASTIPISQSHIPDTPNQTEFLARWFEFHQGYRIVRTPDDREQRIAVSGEPLRDVDPGYLPRTLEELRSGRRVSEQLLNQPENTAMALPSSSPSEPSLEETLDGLLEEAMAEPDYTTSHHAPASNESTMAQEQPDVPSQLSFDVPQETVEGAALARTRLTYPDLDRQGAVEQFEEAASARDGAARGQRRRLRRQENTTSNLARVFGTREEIQSDEYVSPITSMFTRVSQWGQRNQAQRRALNDSEDTDQQAQNAELASLLAQNRIPIESIERESRLSDLDVDVFRVRDELREESTTRDPRREALLQTIQDSRDGSMGSLIRGAETLETTMRRLLEQQARIQRLRQGSRYEVEREQIMSSSPAFEQPTGERIRPQSLTRLSEGDGMPMLPSRDYATERRVRIANMDADGLQRREQSRATLFETEHLQNMIEAPRVPSIHSRALNLLREARGNLERSRESAELGDVMTTENFERSLRTIEEAEAATRLRLDMLRLEPPSTIRGLDGDDRPEAKTDEEMVVKLECRICYSQIADTACLPCGHLAMCQWCADQALPVSEMDRTRPRDKFAKCPTCRAKVKQRVRIFTS